MCLATASISYVVERSACDLVSLLTVQICPQPILNISKRLARAVLNALCA